jgi:hypothetical protein
MQYSSILKKLSIANTVIKLESEFRTHKIAGTIKLTCFPINNLHSSTEALNNLHPSISNLKRREREREMELQLDDDQHER